MKDVAQVPVSRAYVIDALDGCKRTLDQVQTHLSLLRGSCHLLEGSDFTNDVLHEAIGKLSDIKQLVGSACSDVTDSKTGIEEN